MGVTSYFIFIALAYGITLGALGGFLGACFFHWKRTAQALKNVPHEA